MKGYKFKVEFVVWRRKNQLKAKEELEDFLLESGQEEGFNIKAPKFIGKIEDPLSGVREQRTKGDK